MKSKSDMLAKAIVIATNAHKNQKDKAGNPYILHPLHVMSHFVDDHELAAIAVLHDVVEDTDVSLSDLVIAGMSDRIINGVTALTHDTGVSYTDYIIEIAINFDANIIKMKDLEHNMDLNRLPEVTEYDLKRTKKYYCAHKFLDNVKFEWGNRRVYNNEFRKSMEEI